MAVTDRNLWSLTSAPANDIQALMDQCEITTIGELCEVPEGEIAQRVSPEGLAAIKRDLSYHGLSLAATPNEGGCS